MRSRSESPLFFTVPETSKMGLSPLKATFPMLASTSVEVFHRPVASLKSLRDTASTEPHGSGKGVFSQVKHPLAAMVSPGRMNPVPPLIPSREYISAARMNSPRLIQQIHGGTEAQRNGERVWIAQQDIDADLPGRIRPGLGLNDLKPRWSVRSAEAERSVTSGRQNVGCPRCRSVTPKSGAATRARLDEVGRPAAAPTNRRPISAADTARPTHDAKVPAFFISSSCRLKALWAKTRLVPGHVPVSGERKALRRGHHPASGAARGFGQG